MTSVAAYWPPAGLALVCGELELRIADDPTLAALGELAGRGVHAQDAMPFLVPWTRGAPADVARAVLTHHWGLRSRMGPEAWSLEFAVFENGVPVGMQGLVAKDFPVLRTAETGSWLGREHQGHGIGRTMRLMVLHLLFDGLGGERATTSAFADNPASNAVTRRLGYATNGDQYLARDGVPQQELRYVMTRAAWEQRPDEHRLDVRFVGLDAVRQFLQID